MGGIVKSIFGGDDAPAPAPIPMPAEPKATPMIDEESIARKKKAKIAAERQRGGRASTILSEVDTLG